MLQQIAFSATFPATLAASTSGGLAALFSPDTPRSRAARQAGKLATDNSRAAPPPELQPGAQGLSVSEELARLVELNAMDKPEPPITLPPQVNHNVPPQDQRYMTMPLRALLTEVSQRALGEGPADALPIENPGVPAETRRLGDMRFALLFQPGRERDEQRLLSAGRALYNFWYDYRGLVGRMRGLHPELEPAIGPWAHDLAQSAIRRALLIPLDDDGQAQYDPGLYGAIDALARRPLQDYLPDLERRMGLHRQGLLQQELGLFFERIAQPASPDVPVSNGVLGAPRNLLGGHEFYRLRRGDIVFSCRREDLVANLRTIPAGKLWPLPARTPDMVAHPEQRYAIRYPDRASGTTIHNVYWRNEAGVVARVLVALHHGVHSFRVEGDGAWTPTGADGAKALEDMRAEGWRSFLAQRWHDYNQALLLGWPGGGIAAGIGEFGE
ncbi:hypothetical protein GT347_07720 [Xylophilus rhododendri]|uniref:Uncharacterized protein n=1 Tax=Xylophilus rhododendri TaxID=2697032 RepID=A0A857J4C1_9BURK|nr:hypothetical protein [Xylophilus rhododendri]QHI97892.1 hypothetical protein GT347_07720 [Xylophilus rhododendri]